MRASRVRYLEQYLKILGYNQALKALDLVVNVMSAKNGYKRHDGSNYYYHLVDATQDLLNHGVRDEITITACLLHDFVEDVEWATIGYIESEYGEEVAIVVELVTKKKHVDYKNPVNMNIYLGRIIQNWRASLIKTADRKHNFSTLRHATREKKLRQAKETETLFIPFFKECRKLYPRYADYFFSAKTAIEPHLWEIKERYAEVEELEKKLQEFEALKLKATLAYEGWSGSYDVFNPMMNLKAELNNLGVKDI